MTSTRANKGGEYGVNGEFYNGGQFLPSSPTTIKGEFSRVKNEKQSKPRKQEIAPYKWEISEKKSIWSQLDGRVRFIGQTSYSKETGKVGTIELAGNWDKDTQDYLNNLIERWNNGERWI